MSFSWCGFTNDHVHVQLWEYKLRLTWKLSGGILGKNNSQYHVRSYFMMCLFASSVNMREEKNVNQFDFMVVV